MIKTNVAFLEGRLFSNQSKLFENILNCFDWLKKSRPAKKATFVWSCNHVNRLPLIGWKTVSIESQHRLKSRL